MCSPKTYACKGVFGPNIPLFLPNSAKGLHFTAFHFNKQLKFDIFLSPSLSPFLFLSLSLPPSLPPSLHPPSIPLSLSLSQNGNTCLHLRESLESIDLVRYLVHNGAPVDAPSKVVSLASFCFSQILPCLIYTSLSLPFPPSLSPSLPLSSSLPLFPSLSPSPLLPSSPTDLSYSTHSMLLYG